MTFEDLKNPYSQSCVGMIQGLRIRLQQLQHKHRWYDSWRTVHATRLYSDGLRGPQRLWSVRQRYKLWCESDAHRVDNCLRLRLWALGKNFFRLDGRVYPLLIFDGNRWRECRDTWAAAVARASCQLEMTIDIINRTPPTDFPLAVWYHILFTYIVNIDTAIVSYHQHTLAHPSISMSHTRSVVSYSPSIDPNLTYAC